MVWLFFTTTFVLALSSASPLLESLEELDVALISHEKRASQLASAIKRLQEESAELDTQLASNRVKRNEVFAQHKMRLRALVRMPATSRIALLGSTESFSDYVQVKRALTQIARYDQMTYRNFLKAERTLKENEQAKQEKVQQLNNTVSEEKQVRLELESQRRVKLQKIAELLADPKHKDALAKEIQKAHSQLAKLLEHVQPAGTLSRDFEKNKKRLPWPTLGAIATGFGDHLDPKFSTKISTTGIEIRTRLGAEVRSIADGSVVFVDMLSGYGQTVIVEHGDNFLSLYAHLDSIAVAKGQAIKATELVGTVGESSSLDGAKLYFEIRKGGVALDPMTWLRP